jgi:hypothetical protein
MRGCDREAKAEFASWRKYLADVVESWWKEWAKTLSLQAYSGLAFWVGSLAVSDIGVTETVLTC